MAVGEEGGIKTADPLLAIGIEADLVERDQDVLILQAVHLSRQQHRELWTGARLDRSERLDQGLAVVARVNGLDGDPRLFLEVFAVAIHDSLQWATDRNRVIECQLLHCLSTQYSGHC